jgi:hypothetical protein
MERERDFELDEIKHLHERLNYPRMVLLLQEMERQGKGGNNWKLATKYGLSIYDLNAIRHWLFEERVMLKRRVKSILRAKIRQIAIRTHS